MTVKRRLILFAVAVIIATAAAFVFTQPSVGTSFSASSVETTTHDGEIDAVTIQPKGEISWTGLEEEPDSATVTVQVETEDGWETVASRDFRGIQGLDGSRRYAFKRVDLTETGLSDNAFKAADGETAETTVSIRIVTTVHAGQDRTDTVSDSFTVSVSNKAADADVSGHANTGVQSDSEVEG